MLVTIASFTTPLEAHMVRSLLESEGIESLVFNEQIAGVHLPLAAATGGVQVQVLESDADRAREILERNMAGEEGESQWREDEMEEGET
ncbi:MAG: DUF2007 domain-containing protein [Abitibacteriaceae bacterium]|nr:DUF2007 domain-containing protein [Abditibacteriaceae bacterium]